MRVFSVFLLVLFSIFSVFSEDYLNNSAFIAQKGFGETEQIAQQNALAGISKFFQTSITVEASEKTKVTDSGSQSELSENVFVKSQTELFAVHYTKAKYNKKQKLYELTAYIDREEAWQIYKPKVESCVQSFERLYSDAKNQNENILKITGFVNALKNANQNELEKKLDFASSLYPDSDLFYEETRNHLSETEPIVKSLCRKCSMNIVCENDFEDRVQKRAEETFSKIGIGTNENAENKYFCVVTILENKQTLDAGTFYTPSFTLEIENASVTLFSVGKQLKRTGAKNENVAKQRAYSAVANAVGEMLKNEFMAY